MTDASAIFQAFVAPAIFLSATGLLLLSLNVRLMGMVSRLRQFQRERHIATVAGRLQEAEALAEQVASIEYRAEQIRRAMHFLLLSLAGAIVSCLLLALGLYWKGAQVVAVAVFVVATLLMLLGTLYYFAEIRVALTSVREEAKYFHFMDLARYRAGDAREAEERREDWQRPH